MDRPRPPPGGVYAHGERLKGYHRDCHQPPCPSDSPGFARPRRRRIADVFGRLSRRLALPRPREFLPPGGSTSLLRDNLPGNGRGVARSWSPTSVYQLHL